MEQEKNVMMKQTVALIGLEMKQEDMNQIMQIHLWRLEKGEHVGSPQLSLEDWYF